MDTALRSDDEGDEDEDDAVACRDIPAKGKPYVHHNDIMSCCFDLKNLLIFTGGVDGTIIGWNFETSFPRYHLHQWDETCTSDNFIADSKSVDSLVILE